MNIFYHVILYHVSCFMILLTISWAEKLISDPFSDSFIDLINSKQSSWKAGRNFPDYMTLSTIKKLLGALEDPHIKNLARVEHSEELKANLPENFDSRDKWPYCPSLNEISDQGACGSCWAFGAVDTMTDRYCIYSNGTKHFHFSAEDVLSCCTTCGFGCEGGMESQAWLHWQENGIVSGGSYNSSQGCRPYEIAPCEHNVSGNRKPCGSVEDTPKCNKTCQKGYPSTYEADKKYGKQIYGMGGEDNIKAEIFNNGSVMATFEVYTDFVTYKSGVYKHTFGEDLGGHVVKMLGWGVENGQKYWLIANSWNSDWGDKGFFKILRGENHCNIEQSVLAGEPLYQ